MIVFVFVVTLLIPSFGGPVTATLSATTEDGCWKLRRAAQELINANGIRARVTECHERTAP